MGCKTCKDKEKLKKELVQTTGGTSKGIITFFIVWSLFSIYGFGWFVYNLIKWIN